jgi:hypothetical protein
MGLQMKIKEDEESTRKIRENKGAAILNKVRLA